MKPKKVRFLTHKNTIPIDEKKGRKKPFRLRVTIGGKRQESYWATREEAEAEWSRLAPLAGHPGAVVTPSVEKSLVNDQEAAQFILLRERLEKAGLTVESAITLALANKDRPTKAAVVTPKRVLEEFLASMKGRARKPCKAHIDHVERTCTSWAKHFGEDRDIREIKRGYEEQFAAWVNGLGLAPDSVLYIFRNVRQLLNFAVKRRGYLDYNPLTHAMSKDGLLPSPRANQSHTITLEQATALMAIVEIHYPHLAHNLAMQFTIGFRETQVERMRREYFKSHLNAFDLPPGIIRKARDGSAGDYLDELPDNLIAWIKFGEAAIARQPGRKPDEYKAGEGPWPSIGRKVWVRIMKRMAELPKPYRLSKWPKNACRHTAATVAFSHFGIKRTCSMLGWVDEKMLKDQYAGKRWPADRAKAYFEIAPGIAAQLCREHPELKGLITGSLFPRGGVKGWKKPTGWKKRKVSSPEICQLAA